MTPGPERFHSHMMHKEEGDRLFYYACFGPSIRGTDHAFWRRIREIPFTVAIPEQQAIKNMDRILRGEYSGILNWCIEGCRRWQQAGLITPEVVQDATEAYKAEQDILVQFFDSECVLASKERLAADANKHISKIAIKICAKQLHNAFNRWIESNTSRGPMAPHLFSKAMIDHGYEPQTHDRTVWYVGINLRHEPTKEQPSASIDQ
jgi:putative DNA primase/helicase